MKGNKTMQEYNQLSENSALRGNFLNAYPVLAANSSPYGRASSDSKVSNHKTQMPLITFHLQSSGWYESAAHPVVKTEAINSQHGRKFQYPLLRGHQAIHHQQARNESSIEVEAIKGKIVAHPRYLNLLKAYMDCQKVGAPPEVVARLSAAGQEFEARQRSSVTSRGNLQDPELDQFMEAYHGMLVKYREELTRPIQESFDFMRRIEAQLNLLSNGPLRIFNSGSSEEDQEDSGGEIELPAEDQELRNHLLRKYSGGYISSLKQELSKKKKRGKLPKEARQNLLRWWELHYKWPYPSETEKLALAESTGLNQKQISNWFINQRKRHRKPSENMQFMVTAGLQPQNATDGPYLLG